MCIFSLQLTNWLTDPGTFLSDQTEFGTSVATAEDLLMEHNEFETGAQVTSTGSHDVT